MAYTPSDLVLRNYAKVLIHFALNSGEGAKPGEVVLISLPECSKPLYVPLLTEVLAAGANPLFNYLPDGVSRAFYEQASDAQLSFFPAVRMRGTVDQINHSVMILAETDKQELAGIEPVKLLSRQRAWKPYQVWRQEKEAVGNFTWTLGLYGTAAMAEEVGMSEEEYWKQIIAACYLDEQDPVAAWKQAEAEIARLKDQLNALSIDRIRIEAVGTDLTVGIGANRQWIGGGGRNIPSFEVFTSPDWRQTEGVISFNQPLYRYGTRIDDIVLRFSKGEIIEATASSNLALLTEIIATEGATRLGEVSLTDKKLSRITQVMGETLYDENMGGAQGNTHVAIGNSYHDTYPGDQQSVSPEQWEEWGYNSSAEHVDIIATTPRTVTATLRDGSTKVIYTNGSFTL